jgi:hypothetical protein
MYAGRALSKDDELLPAGDVVIPVVDISAHRHESGMDEAAFLWDEYTWSGEALRMGGEGRMEVNAASPGVGAAVNCFLALTNIEEGSAVTSSAGLHRSKDPGAGAFSYFYDRRSTAKRNITAGEELFVSCT